jgi:hypothetical protein
MDLRCDAERLFDVTMWCLGRDVNHPEGNLLLRRGLSRERPPPGQQANSVYTASLPGGGVLKLWGFGVFSDDCDGAVFVSRDGFTPHLVDSGAVLWPVFHAEDLRAASREPLTLEGQRACRAAVVTLAEWLAGYEGWVVDQLGSSWRRACLAERRKGSPASGDELAAAWWRISTRTRALDFVVNDLTTLIPGA